MPRPKKQPSVPQPNDPVQEDFVDMPPKNVIDTSQDVSQPADHDCCQNVFEDPEFIAMLSASCLGALRDRMSGAPMSDQEFAYSAPVFVKQSVELARMIFAELNKS